MNQQPHDFEWRASDLWGDSPFERRPALGPSFPADAASGTGGLWDPSNTDLSAAYGKRYQLEIKPSARAGFPSGSDAATATPYSEYAFGDPLAGVTTFPETEYLTLGDGPPIKGVTADQVLYEVAPMLPLMEHDAKLSWAQGFQKKLGNSDMQTYYMMLPLDMQVAIAQRFLGSTLKGDQLDAAIKDFLAFYVAVSYDGVQADGLVQAALASPDFSMEHLVQMAAVAHDAKTTGFSQSACQSYNQMLSRMEGVLKNIHPEDRSKALGLALSMVSLPPALQEAAFASLGQLAPDTRASTLDRKLSAFLKQDIESHFGVKLTAKDGRYWSVDQLAQAYQAIHAATGVKPGETSDAMKGVEIQLRKRPPRTGDLLKDMAPVTGFYAPPGSPSNPGKNPVIVIFGSAESKVYELPDDVKDDLTLLVEGLSRQDGGPSTRADGTEIPYPSRAHVISLQKTVDVFQDIQRSELTEVAHDNLETRYQAALSTGSSYCRLIEATCASPKSIADPALVFGFGELLGRAQLPGEEGRKAREELQAFLGALDPHSGLAGAIRAIYSKELSEFSFAAKPEDYEAQLNGQKDGPPYLLPPGSVPGGVEITVNGEGTALVLRQKQDEGKLGAPMSNLFDMIDPAKAKTPLGSPPIPYTLSDSSMPNDEFFMARYGTLKGPKEAFIKLNGNPPYAGGAVRLPPETVTPEEVLLTSHLAAHQEDSQTMKEAYTTLINMPKIAFDGDYGTRTREGVRQLQEFLIKKGYPIPLEEDGRPDGIFGPTTAKYLMNYLIQFSPSFGGNPLEGLIVHEAGHHMQHQLTTPPGAEMESHEAQEETALVLADFATISGWIDNATGQITDGRKHSAMDAQDAHENEAHSEDILGNLVSDGHVDGGLFHHMRTDNFVTPYAMTDPKEDFAESYGAFISDPEALMAKSPEKFLFFSGLERAKGITRYSDEEILKMADNTKVGAGGLYEAMRNLSGEGNIPYTMRSETFAKISTAHSELFASVDLSDTIDPWAAKTPKQELGSEFRKAADGSFDDYQKWLATLEAAGKKDGPLQKPAGFEGWTAIDKVTRGFLKRETGFAAVQLADHVASMTSSQLAAFWEDPRKALGEDLWERLPDSMRIMLANDPKHPDHDTFIGALTCSRKEADGTITLGPERPAMMMTVGLIARTEVSIAGAKIAISMTHDELLGDDGRVKLTSTASAAYGDAVAKLGAAVEAGLTPQVQALLEEVSQAIAQMPEGPEKKKAAQVLKQLTKDLGLA